MPIDWSRIGPKHLRKPLPGSRRRELKTKNGGIRRKQEIKKNVARVRDMNACGGCRWPRKDHDTKGHACEGPLQVAHGRAIGMGGDKTADAERTTSGDSMVVCEHIHLRSKDSIEAHGRRWIGNTNGPVQFERRGVIVGVERRIGVLTRAQ